MTYDEKYPSARKEDQEETGWAEAQAEDGSTAEEEGQTPKRRRGRGWATFLIALGAVVALMIAFGAYLYMVLPAKLPWGEDGMFTLLMVGTDVDYIGPATKSSASIGRADTVMLLLMPRGSQSATIVSIPRDTLIKANGGSRKVRFNSLYKGLPPEQLIEGVKTLTGLEVDRWVGIDFDAFVGFVDAIGGVEVDVVKRMRYTDNAGGYSLDLQPGHHLLDGRTALAYVRYRNDALGDISRVARQQDFVKEIARKTITLSSLSKIDEFKAILDKYVKNDMNLYEYAAIGMRALKIGPSNFESTTLPGNFSGPYWEADAAKVTELILKVKGERPK